MSELALPDPRTTTVAQVRDALDRVPAIREEIRAKADRRGADELHRQLEAMSRYVRDKATRTQCMGESRRTEILIGQFLGVGVDGRPKKSSNNLEDYLDDQNERHWFRTLAAHEDLVEDLLAHGAVSLHRILREIRKATRRAETPPMPTALAHVLLADPPWRYDAAETEMRHLENQYETMSVEQICDLAPPAEDDAVLFCWATSPMLREALRVVAAWGFEYRTCMVWVKDRIGMGYYARQQHEILLIGRRGELPVPVPAARPPSVFYAPRGRHSAKPDVAYELIERMYPNVSRCEMFARSARPGWIRWGFEAPV